MRAAMVNRPGHHVNVNSGENVQIQVEATNSSQTIMTGHLTRQEIEEYKEYLKEYRRYLGQFTPSKRDSAEQHLQTAEEQLNSRRVRRDNAVLREAMRSLRNIAESTTGGMAFVGLVELAHRLGF
jgi:hypothetical protein